MQEDWSNARAGEPTEAALASCYGLTVWPPAPSTTVTSCTLAVATGTAPGTCAATALACESIPGGYATMVVLVVSVSPGAVVGNPLRQSGCAGGCRAVRAAAVEQGPYGPACDWYTVAAACSS